MGPGAAGGLTGLQLKTGDDGKAQIKRKARRTALDVPVLPLVQAPQPVRAILLNKETGTSWEASYRSASSDPASTTKWTARTD